MVEKGAIWKYGMALGFGLLVGYRVLPPQVVGTFYVFIIISCIVYAAQNRLDKFLSYLPFAVYNEVYVRTYLQSIPYLGMSYLYIISFAVMLINMKKNRVAHTKIYYFMLGFAILEIVNGFFPTRPLLLRSIFFNSFTIVLAVVWASHTALTPRLINKLLASIKLAAVYLAGVIIVAHLTGTIVYGNFSNADASNGLAPVQISGYLSVGCAILFIGLIGNHEKKNKILNFALFVFVGIVMVLTFSRGGLYFVAAIAAAYMFFNRKQLGNYFKYLLMVPVVIVVANFVVSETGGAITKRYEEKGSSNRDLLVEAGYKLFLMYPVFGVGTSNYGTAIKENKLFDQESTAHNEFVRAMAEHGIFGIVTYWGFFIGLVITILLRKEPNRQYSVYFLMLFCFILIHNGLKISVQPILIIVAVANPSNVLSARKKNINVVRRSPPLQQSA